MEIGRGILSAGFALRRLLDGNLKSHGLTGAQVHVLGVLSDRQAKGQTTNQREIASRCGNIRSASVTNLLQTLERRGYVIRESGKDAREKSVCLTEEGARIAKECRAFVDKVERTMSQSFTVPEAEEFARCLSKTISLLSELETEFRQ